MYMPYGSGGDKFYGGTGAQSAPSGFGAAPTAQPYSAQTDGAAGLSSAMWGMFGLPNNLTRGISPWTNAKMGLMGRLSDLQQQMQMAAATGKSPVEMAQYQAEMNSIQQQLQNLQMVQQDYMQQQNQQRGGPMGSRSMGRR